MADQAAIKAAMAEFMKRTREAPNSGNRPPNLTTTEDTRKNCSTCQYWEAGLCKLYDYHTQANQVCDSWSPVPEGSK